MSRAPIPDWSRCQLPEIVYTASMPCDGCGANASGDRLSLTVEGQHLCRMCFGSYQAAKADKRARAADVYRRCRCGAVLSPIGETTIEPYYESADGTNGNLEYVFQPRKYHCSTCAAAFTVRHGVITAIPVVFIAITALMARAATSSDQRVAAVGIVVVLAVIVVWEVAKRLRYPRVR